MTPQNPRGWSAAGPNVRPIEASDPASVGALRLLGRLGEGGMGVVYLGLASSGRKVAVKVVRRELAGDPSFRARFDAEVANARRVASFCTARVLDHGEAGGLPYLVTEYIDGPSLADYIDACGGFPPDALRSLAVGVATALTAIHAVRLVHRDLKPRNVLLADDGPRVIDFGIARALDSEDHHTRTGAVLGSPGYMAPEQAFQGQVSPAADVFAWGTLIAYAATGRNPFGTGNLVTLAARAQQAGYDLSGVPQDVLPVVQAALDPDPARRPSAEALLVRLVGEQAPKEAASDLIHNEWRPGAIPPGAAAPAQPGAVLGAERVPGPPRESSVATPSPFGTVPQRPSRHRTWKVAAVASAVTALIVLGATSAVFYALGHSSDGGRPAGAAVAAPRSAASPSLPSGSPALSASPSPSKPSRKSSTKPRTEPSANPTVTVTRPVKHWRDIGGLDRMAEYCAALGFQETVTYTEGGRKWWCEGSGDSLQPVDLQASCQWHYRKFPKVRAVQRPAAAGSGYEVQWLCQALT
ncbi:serine/threonine-protein kinase [Actinomadura nitritigenes]|uniref:serine/threonine-protein kinase n=1 Tax=Actinomadura nitritigenes TaxID=134602 RepID=UPI003D91D062